MPAESSALPPYPATDVVVVGGGPAGSTTATMIARHGISVTLLERDHFPREHIGESLLPASVPVLEELGVREKIEAAGFLPKYGATMVWGNGQEPWSWYFRETNPTYPSAWQVWRAEFDKILLDHSREKGVDVREGVRVLEVVFEGERAVGVRFVDDDGKEGTLRASFVVDASGQTALIGRAKRLRKWDPFFQNLAVYAYFEGGERLPAPDETNILIESYPEGWLWAIPLHNGWMSTGAVVDRSRAQGRLDGTTRESFLMEQIAQSSKTKEMMANATIAHGPIVLKDWSYLSDEVVGEGWILAGDSACFVDPLFSSGVHLALSSGVLAAAFVNTWLQDEELGRAAGPVYKDLYYAQYHRFHTMASLFYATNRTQESYFWEARRLLGNPEAFTDPRHAFIHAVAGQPPAGYERVVLARGELPPELEEGVRAAESGLAERRRAVKAAGNDIAGTVPKLDPDLTLLVRPVPERGRFAWSDVVMSPMRPEGAPVSPLVAAAIRLMDGRATVGEIATKLADAAGRQSGEALTPDQVAELERLVSFAAGTLYIEGVIGELVGLNTPAGA